MKKRTLRRSIIAYSSVILSILTLAAVFSSYATAEISRSVEVLFLDNLKILSIGDDLTRAEAQLKAYLRTKDSENLSEFLRASLYLKEVAERMRVGGEYSEAGLLKRGVGYLLGGFLKAAEDSVAAKRGRNVERYTLSFDTATNFSRMVRLLQERQQALYLSANLKTFTQFSQLLPLAVYSNMAMLLTAFILGFILMVQFSYRITDPLHHLAQAASAIGKGDFHTPYLFPESTDEVRVTVLAFRTMQENVQKAFQEQARKAVLEKRLLEEEYHVALMRHQLKEAELLALQTQINPHFLYNTLSAGLQMAWSENADRTADFLENLGAFFRYVLRSPSRLVAVEEEAECVQWYIKLMRSRFADRFRFEIDIEEAARTARIPALLLQPLVENAITHGLGDREEGGTVRITARRDRNNKCVCLSVSDNGRGMPQDHIADLMDDAKGNNQDASIGMHNVIRRVRVVTAGQGKVELANVPEGGFRVNITLPWVGIRN